MFIISLSARKENSVLWLLGVSAYGLVDPNAIWQNKCDDTFISLGLERFDLIPHRFMLRRNEEVNLILIKIVDDIILTSIDEHLPTQINAQLQPLVQGGRGCTWPWNSTFLRSSSHSR